MNIEEVIEKYQIDLSNPRDVVKKLTMLSEFYERKELIEIYNSMLSRFKTPNIRIEIIKILEVYKDKSSLPLITDILRLKADENNNFSEDDINLRVICAKFAAKYKDKSIVDVLLSCLNNKFENYKVRLACADALGRIGDTYAVKPLINVVKDEEEKSVYVKESAAFALGLIGDTSAIDPLVSILESKQGIWDKFSFLKEKIVEVLGKLNINNQKVLKVFRMSILDSSPMVRINTIEALMNSEFDEAPELIKQSLKDSDEEVQKNALIALYNIIGDDILDEVISLPSYSDFLKEEAKKIKEEFESEGGEG